MIRSRTIIATPPGATIKEQLESREMSQKEFSSRMEMSEKHISKLVNGEVQLTPDVAMRLEMVLGIPARFWNNLEAIYREKLARAIAENEMDEDIELAKKFPYKRMADLGWLPETTKNEEKVFCLRKFFEVVRLGRLDDNLLPQIACRRQLITEKADFALLAWAQKAKLEARHIETSNIDLKSLKENLPKIRTMTMLSPDVFCDTLKFVLANCGIALVFLPHLDGSFLHGATFVDSNRIVMGLTVRGKDADKFWFSLFHEIGHILSGHIWDFHGLGDEHEKEADVFAQEALIPQKEFDEFVGKGIFSRSSIFVFSQKINIAQGIIVGRLQREGYLKYSWLNDLKERYEISE